MGEEPSRFADFPLHALGFYAGVGSVLLALTTIFNFLPLPFMRPLSTLAWFSLILGLGALALGFVTRRQTDDPNSAAMSRGAMVAGGTGMILFVMLSVLGPFIGRLIAG